MTRAAIQGSLLEDGKSALVAVGTSIGQRLQCWLESTLILIAGPNSRLNNKF
jgi:hypothetical protein